MNKIHILTWLLAILSFNSLLIEAKIYVQSLIKLKNRPLFPSYKKNQYFPFFSGRFRPWPLFLCVTNKYMYIETVSFCSFVCVSICLSRKESPLTATIFHPCLPNFYSMFISLKHFVICSFIKKMAKIVAVFLFKL